MSRKSIAQWGCLGVALCCMALACELPEDDRQAGGPQSPFYDLQQFFEDEVQRLQSEQPTLEKTVAFDGQRSTQTVDSMDYARELKVFLDADINRPAWWDRYAIDSTRENGTLESIRYQALDEDLKIREIKLTFEADSLREVDILQRAASAATSFDQNLYYAPAWGYRIRTVQDVVLSEEKTMEVEATFRP